MTDTKTKFKATNFYEQYGACYNVECPSKLTGSINENIGLESIVSEVIEQIKSCDVPGGNRIFHSDARIPYNNLAYDKKNNVAAFVLLQETSLLGGMSWKEGIYAIKVNKDNVVGELIRYNRGSHTNTAFGEININPGSRLMVNKIEDGILHYTHITKEGSDERKYDIKGLK